MKKWGNKKFSEWLLLNPDQKEKELLTAGFDTSKVEGTVKAILHGGKRHGDNIRMVDLKKKEVRIEGRGGGWETFGHLSQ